MVACLVVGTRKLVCGAVLASSVGREGCVAQEAKR